MDEGNIDSEKIRYIAKILRNGGLVAFPTETVYGIGSNALNPDFVKMIFKAKGRPSDNPLIIHIADKNEISSLISKPPRYLDDLIEEYWPGPLTLIFKKSSIVPDIVTSGLSTVAVRMPAHPIAKALIKETGLPIAAPSANLSGKPSPTIAKHVIEDLYGKIDIIIDAQS